MNANRTAQRDAARSRAAQEQLIGRQVDAYDKFAGWLDNAIADGQFDPEKAIQTLESDAARTHERDVKNLAGGMRLLGYGPGDSEANTQLREGEKQYRQNLDVMRLNQRRQSLMDLIGAYNAVSGASGGLNAGIQNAMQQQQIALGQQQSPAGMFGAIMPFLRTAAPTANAPKAPVSPTGSPARLETFDPTIRYQPPSLNMPSFPTNYASSFNGYRVRG